MHFVAVPPEGVTWTWTVMDEMDLMDLMDCMDLMNSMSAT